MNFGRVSGAPLIVLAAILSGCGGSQSAASVPPISAGAAAQTQAFSTQPDIIKLIVTPKKLVILGPGQQGFISVHYDGLHPLTATSSRPHGMTVHPRHDTRRPKVFIITQHCRCEATITVRDNVGHHDTMTVQGT